MSPEKALEWFRALHAKGDAIPSEPDEWGTIYEPRATIAWVMEADAAIKAVFPAGHPTAMWWQSALTSQPPTTMANTDRVNAFRALFDAAIAQLEGGRIGSLVEGVRADNARDLLGQAEVMVRDRVHLAAPTVIAGGALESTLRHLCTAHGLTWKGAGSISVYIQASTTDEKHVLAWGGLRNDAAHDPEGYGKKRTAPEVERMIDGVRHFIAEHMR